MLRCVDTVARCVDTVVYALVAETYVVLGVESVCASDNPSS
jgi:hypothetical protein